MASVIEPKTSGVDATDSAKIGLLAGDSLAFGVLFALLLTVGQRAIGFVRGTLFCRWMTDQELGQWSMTWGFLMLLPPFFALGLPGCFGKYTEYFRQRGCAQRFIWQVAIICAGSGLMGSAAMILWPSFFSEVFFRDPGQGALVIGIAVTLVGVGVANFTVSLLESLRQIRLVTWIRFITAVSFAVVGCAAILIFENVVLWVTLSFGLCSLLGLVPVVWILIRLPRGQMLERDEVVDNQAAIWTRILPFAGWLWCSNLLNNSIELADRYMLLQWSTVSPEVAQSYVGQYHSSRMIPMLLSSLAVMLGGMLLPYLSMLWERGEFTAAAKQLNLSYKVTGLAMTFGSVLILLGSPLFFEYLLMGNYSAGQSVFPMTMVLFVWFSLYIVGQDYLWVAEKGKWVSVALLISLGTNVVANGLLIPTWGLEGAVLGTAIANLTLVFLILLMNHGAGCHNDTGCWIVLAMPIILLLPPVGMLAAVLGLLWLSFRTDWLFDSREQQLAVEHCSALIAKFRR